MSLVAYASSSGEESEVDDDETITIVKTDNVAIQTQGHKIVSLSGDIANENHSILNVKKNLQLPAPNHHVADDNFDNSEGNDKRVPLFGKLPPPKSIQPFKSTEIIEEDDEFLHKKAAPPQEIQKPPKKPVKITIPSLSEFKDLEENVVKKGRSAKPVDKMSSLLSLLPKPKSEVIFSKTDDATKDSTISNKNTTLIPDSVKNAQIKSKVKAANAQVLKNYLKKPQKPTLIKKCSDSEDSDNENGDFFSLNTNKNDLPQVGENEINAMVARRAAQIAEASSRIDEMLKPQVDNEPISQDNSYNITPNSENANFDDEAMYALVGSRAKRAKLDNVQIVELSSAEVLPDKDEWLRTALASATEYQPKGVLIDEEPAPGTRKKHQITYLAHQAKANEQELQAMWSANRHTRRQTQSKYGF